ncbi:preprotein translocase subunit SecY [Candidatus Pseudoscillospira sp. SGI.172]|uniref:preprotein translocase subunit SecY n=1 Tax=Candidatus Pseudoscillospira sp. SGI.172 TaxID=3420582 RepID=UPI0009BB0AF5|nr:preprotein translocase subunit SecY [Oscillospiraceae bacterium]
MIQTLKNAWKVPELKNKILFTVFALLIFRLGSAVPVPFIQTDALADYISSMSGTIFGLLGTMNGTAFSIAAVFALGVQPYINSSIIIQLLTVAVPALERLAKDGGEEGKKKIAAITRYVTVAIAILQGFGYYTIIRTNNLLDLGGMNGIWAAIVIVATFAAGSAFVMWLGEQITDKGIGNGISMILFAGILSRMPQMIRTMATGVSHWAHPVDTTDFTAQQLANYFVMPPWGLALIIIGMLALILFVVWIQNAERRIPVQYAKRVVGRKMYGGQSSHIPMKVNMSGVLPIIFAQSIASLPATICAFAGVQAGDEGFWGGFLKVFDANGIVYTVVYFLLILAFSYFYSTMQFDPVEVANNLKKNGGFVPGFRPGKPTADFIRKVLNKITFFGAIFLSVIAIAPIVTGNIIGVQSLAIGGTSIIIVVGVALETSKALEAQLMMRHYKGFLE